MNYDTTASGFQSLGNQDLLNIDGGFFIFKTVLLICVFAKSTAPVVTTVKAIGKGIGVGAGRAIVGYIDDRIRR